MILGNQVHDKYVLYNMAQGQVELVSFLKKKMPVDTQGAKAGPEGQPVILNVVVIYSKGWGSPQRFDHLQAIVARRYAWKSYLRLVIWTF